MTRVNAQPQRQDYVVSDSASVKANHQVPDYVLNSNDRVTQEELKEISMFSSDSDVMGAAYGIGAIAIGSVALAYGAKRFGLLNKLFTLIEKNGVRFKNILNKQSRLKFYPISNKKIATPNNSLMSKRIKNLHPTNLRNELERCDYSRQELINLINSNPQLDKLVGNVPSSWMQGTNPRVIRQEIDTALSKFAKDFHAIEGSKGVSVMKTDTLEKELSAILGNDVKIISLGGGCVGNAYKITTKGESFVYKVYYNKPFLTQENIGHGNYAELAAAIKAQKLCPKKFTPFYMGRFGEKESGYMLTKFIPKGDNYEEYVHRTKNPTFSRLLRKIKTKDGGPDNVRQGDITIDFGSAYFTDYFRLSPKAQKIARKLFPVLDGKSPEKVRKLAQQHYGTKELDEVKVLIENNCKELQKYMLSKKANLSELGIDVDANIARLPKPQKKFTTAC